MAARTRPDELLAHETHGEGVPVVFLHGLTFGRGSWRPIISRLGAGVRSIAIDLPGHGGSAGPACGLEQLAGRIAHTLDAIGGIDAPIVVGHSMSGGLAMMYAGAHPVRGVVDVDQPWNIRPFAELVQHAAPTLCGERFSSAFNMFERTMGLDLLSSAVHADVVAGRRVDRDVVLGYWDEILHCVPSQLQRRIELQLASVTAPCLAVFGHELSADERQHMIDLVPDVQLEEWHGAGHMVHLVDPDRFATRLGIFIDHCAPSARGPAAESREPVST
jgi:pimeloyl-ACP methyl ester carboxylesterase